MAFFGSIVNSINPIGSNGNSQQEDDEKNLNILPTNNFTGNLPLVGGSPGFPQSMDFTEVLASNKASENNIINTLGLQNQAVTGTLLENRNLFTNQLSSGFGNLQTSVNTGFNTVVSQTRQQAEATRALLAQQAQQAQTLQLQTTGLLGQNIQDLGTLTSTGFQTTTAGVQAVGSAVGQTAQLVGQTAGQTADLLAQTNRNLGAATSSLAGGIQETSNMIQYVLIGGAIFAVYYVYQTQNNNQ